MERKTWGKILKAPLILLVILYFITSLYAASQNIAEISYFYSFILGAILILYFWGSYLTKKMKGGNLE